MRILLSIILVSFLAVSQVSAAAQQGDTTPPSAPGTPTDSGSVTSSTSATWSWSAATDAQSSIITYFVDIGTTPGGSNVVSQMSTNGALNYTHTGLSNGSTYYARVRAMNGAGLTGDYSGNSDGITVDTAAPTFSSVSASAGSTSATITWSTNEAGTTQVRYGTSSGSYPTTTTLDSSLSTSHSVTVSGLSAGTYYYQVLSNDEVGNSGSSSEASFTIQATASPSPSETASATTSPSLSASATTSSSPSASATASSSPTSQSTTSSSTSTPATIKPTTPRATASASASASPAASASASASPEVSASPSPSADDGLLYLAADTESLPTDQPDRWPDWLTMMLLSLLLLLLLGWFVWAHHGHHHHPREEKRLFHR